MPIHCFINSRHLQSPPNHSSSLFKVSATCLSPPQLLPLTRRTVSLFAASSILTATVTFSFSDSTSWSKPTADFFELQNSGGVKALDLRVGDGSLPVDGDQVSIHYYGRLAAKQGWRFDSTYDHKDQTGEPIPFTFILGSGKVISGIESSVRSMKVGGIRRVIIPPSQGYQNMNQEPIPPNAETVYNNLQPYSSLQRGRIHIGYIDIRHRVDSHQTFMKPAEAFGWYPRDL